MVVKAQEASPPMRSIRPRAKRRSLQPAAVRIIEANELKFQ